MNRTLVCVALSAAALASCAPFKPPPGVTSGRCQHQSWNPEVYTYYGEPAIIIQKLASVPVTLSERRVFVQITQGESSADVRLFEQQEDKSFTVTEWTTKQSSLLLAKIDKAITANQGINCVGEQVEGTLASALKEGKVTKGVPAPVSTQAAFAHPVKNASGKFIKVIIYVLC